MDGKQLSILRGFMGQPKRIVEDSSAETNLEFRNTYEKVLGRVNIREYVKDFSSDILSKL